MSAFSRIDGRQAHEHRRRELFTHHCAPDEKLEEGEEAAQLSLKSSGERGGRGSIFQQSASHSALLMAPDVRVSYAQGETRLMVIVSGPTTSKLESAYDKAHVMIRLHSRVGVLAIQPLSAVGGAAEKRRFLEARHQQLQETYAAALLPLVQASVEGVLCLDQFPRCVISIDVLVLAEDGGLFATVLNGVMCALLEAGLPCRTSFAAVTLSALALRNPHLKEGTKMEEGKKTTTTSPGKKRGRVSEEEDVERNSLHFIVDPTNLEETLCGLASSSSSSLVKSDSQSVGNDKSQGVVTNSNDIAASQAAAFAMTARGQLINQQRDSRTVAVGTFVFGYRPAGGGDPTQGVRYTTMGSHITSGPGSSRPCQLSAVSAAPKPRSVLLQPMEWIQMEQLAMNSARPIFEFYRKLNVPLD